MIRRLVWLSACVVACSDPVAPVPQVAAVVVTPGVAGVYPTTTVQLSALVTDSLGDTLPGRAIQWSTSNGNIAVVDSTGLVTGAGGGTAKIVATSEGYGDTASVVVTVADSLWVYPPAITIATGGTFKYDVVAFDSLANPLVGYPIVWSSADTSIATVADSGLAAGRIAGVTTLTASAGTLQQVVQIRMHDAPRYLQVEAGDGGQICGAASDSLPYCWGTDGLGQFGTGLDPGLLNPTTTPILVADSIRFQMLRGGEGYSCGLAVGGSAYCWGFRASGRLGDGLGGSSAWSPVAVAGGHQFTILGVGHSTGCGIDASADMYCWGRNAYGELGSGALPAAGSALTPVIVAGGLTWRSVAPGTLTTCGITTDSAAYCWGLNDVGQLGTGDSADQVVPVAVVGAHKFVDLSSASQHTCGLTDTGAAYCWGFNGTGALGNGAQTSSPVPVAVSGGHVFTHISTGGQHFGADFSCALAAGGAAYCWGDNSDGELGDGTTNGSPTPVAVTGGRTFGSVSAGVSDACGVTPGGVVYCWGRTFGAVPLRIAGQP